MVKKIILPTPEEDRAITEAALSDPDAQPITDEDIASGKLVFRRGPQVAPTKEQITIRLDPDILVALRAGGRGWQTRANALLRKGLGLS